MIRFGQCLSVNLEHNRFSVARSHLVRSLQIGRQMNMLSTLSTKPLSENGLEEAGCCAMKKKSWGKSGLEPEIYRKRMPLVRPDPGTSFVVREPLFIAVGNDIQYGSTIQTLATSNGAVNQLIDIRPALAVEAQPNGLRLVS